MSEALDPASYRHLVDLAIAEDVGAGDITTLATVAPSARAEAVIVAKSGAVLAGLDIVTAVFQAVDPTVSVRALRRDGDACVPGDRVAEVRGPAAAVLTGERTALNFLQYLSGIATVTRAYADAAGGQLVVLDTRKTTPGMRRLAKYAVRCGGGTNHRAGLHDGILVKDNHIRLAGGIAAAVQRARTAAPGRAIEVETQNLDEVDAAIAAGADVIMLDNLDDQTIATAIARIAGRAKVELSGGMTIDRVRRLSRSGADFVSVGALTHSAPAVDLSLEIERLLSSS